MTADSDVATMESTAGADGGSLSTSGYLRDWLTNVRSGQLGSLPLIVGQLGIIAVFGSLESVFFTERNFVNFLLQLSGMATIAIGIVFVLLIAEIDLSVAYVSAVGGVVTALLLRPGDPGWPWPLAIAAALLVTTAIGGLHGLLVTKAQMPSFVVTLAGLLIWSGVVLIMTTQLSTAGNIIIQDGFVLGIGNSFLPPVLGWILGVAALAAYASSEVLESRRLNERGVDSKPLPILVLQLVAMAIGGSFVIWYANTDRGVPTAFIIVLGFLVLWTFVSKRMAYGRHIYVVGGSAEAARRAGINVDRIRITVFMISGFMAGAGGIILASRLRSVSTNTGGGNLLLNVIAAAVIGGTSLFGGYGKVTSALLGAMVIASIENGMDLLGLASGVKFVITGIVLLLAVMVDVLSKRREGSPGR